MLGSLQNLILMVLSVAVFVGSVWGLIDALRYPDSSYQAAGKQSRMLWGILLGAATVVSFLSLGGGGVLGLLGIAAIVIVLLYFVDVKPKLQQYGGRGPRRPRQQSGGW
ncbi:DUF2516 family protein [Demequina sp. NBRC 110055]|uniref:DUF2516 family protein n=1 Tax=Demequina sp. NBRC 110055 TaxID=1570344 RepID=UPI000A01BDD0|nr:DUF2516 family protein [Demequina sp. NBRC 110055]